MSDQTNEADEVLCSYPLWWKLWVLLLILPLLLSVFSSFF
jgi:hypothetical protein